MCIAKRFSSFISTMGAALLVLGVPFANAAGERVRFAPRFVSGETFYYQIETRSTTTGKSTTPIEDPEGESKLTQTISLLVRLDVTGVSQGLSGAAQVRFRATFEKSSAQSESDAFDPDAPSLEDQYAHIQGQSIEFTLQPNGQLVDLNGLADVFPNLSETDAVLSWVQALATGGRFPHEGIVIGQKWTKERPLGGSPLSGLFWRTESTYSRDDVCSQADDSRVNQPTRGASDCAVILTRFDILHRGPNQPNATPDEYRRNGLRTSGTWTGSGENLETISLGSGFLESSTQTSTQNMDYQIASATTGSRIHRVSKVESQSEIRRVSGLESEP
jgi:hypothetical protein